MAKKRQEPSLMDFIDDGPDDPPIDFSQPNPMPGPNPYNETHPPNILSRPAEQQPSFWDEPLPGDEDYYPPQPDPLNIRRAARDLSPEFMRPNPNLNAAIRPWDVVNADNPEDEDANSYMRNYYIKLQAEHPEWFTKRSFSLN